MYAKIFESIYDGSLRKDWKALIVFQQLLVLCDDEGYVDKTPEAISARTTIPLEIISHGITELSSPDPDSRSQEFGGKRIVPINPERKWGWKIVNYREYREIRNKEDLRLYWKGQKRDQRLEERGFKRPESVELADYAKKIELPPTESEKFFDHFESNGWRVSGRAPMKDWKAALRKWKTGWIEGRFKPVNGTTNGVDKITHQKEFDRLIVRMEQLKSTYGDHQTWDPKDRAEFALLKSRRNELRTLLGILI